MLKDWRVLISVGFLLVLSLVILRSISPNIFPTQFIYLTFGILVFWIFSQIDFDVLALFSKHFYVLSIILLLITLVIGQVTRGTVRWIPIGPLSLQPAEITRPLLLVFFAVFLTGPKLTIKRFTRAIFLLVLPFILILIQPSLGVSLLMVVGFFGILLSGNFDKKYIFGVIFLGLMIIPIFWMIMKPYQKERILNFGKDYNTVQSIIGVGSGKFFGRGLGRGVQTQLAFLPEKQTDFVFSAVSEELGFLGAGLMLTAVLTIILRLIYFIENAISPAARAYLAGFTLTYLVQVSIHVGMNMGLLPVTGLPFPLVSAGGSSLLATMMGLGIALGAYKK